MNAFDFIKGFLIFCSVCALFFSIGASLGDEYGSSHTSELAQLSGTYNIVSNYSSDSNTSTIRGMGTQMDNSNPTSQELSSFFLRGGIEASKSILGIITIPISIAYITYNNLSFYVPKIFLNLIIGILSAGVIIILLTLIMRTSPRT